ncbi:ATP-dependent 6-phosphofructokinase [Thermodesulfobacteriota bacterium]
MSFTSRAQQDFEIPRLGEPRYDSPLGSGGLRFSDESRRVIYDVFTSAAAPECAVTLEPAGPRNRLYFDSPGSSCGVVTCGGLCPGINDVIRAIVYESCSEYGIRRVYGFRYGYKGIVKDSGLTPIVLNTDIVNEIHEKGGTILGSSRGSQDPALMVDYLQELHIAVLFAIGGDGTLRGAGKLVEEIACRGADIAVIGIPKTIDNDIPFVEKTFGFETAVEESRAVIQAAHIESKGAEHGIGLVKLMGRDSGFIAAQATLANADVNFCLVPEVPFQLEGAEGLLSKLEQRLRRRGHAVIVVAEGAGQNLFEQERRQDASGNILHEDIGVFLQHKIIGHFKQKGFPSTVKYIDPSYIIRSRPANANDSLFCLQMGQHAVHAGMSGRTDMMVSFWNNQYVHVPLGLATSERKKIDPTGQLWQTVVAVTD